MPLPTKILADRLLVEPISVSETTAGGLIIPDISREKPLKGKVILAGPGLSGKDMSVKAGDTVIYGVNSGTEIVFDEKTYVMMRETEISAIV
jgi:chaperonin GroES